MQLRDLRDELFGPQCGLESGAQEGYRWELIAQKVHFLKNENFLPRQYEKEVKRKIDKFISNFLIFISIISYNS